MKDLLVPVEEYLSTTYDPDREYVDGILVERNVGQRNHSFWQATLGSYIAASRDQSEVYGFIAWRMRINASRYRIPDITVTCGWPKDTVLQQPAFLVVEIWSPDDKPRELQNKIRDYREAGVSYILVIYPEEPRFVLYTQRDEQTLADGVLRTENPVIEIPLLEIHRQIPN